ncbi:uncharacterized protein SCODWIG_03940 [Saccharomycodes ludwigii]|uniref:Pre-mRNA-processing protein PRP40 n=1 Tax=Saccharomycodes ludwigii TaxID=36035 RepID=A0A376BBV7_9ASCO|nr:uncharacterized protein SCODWIG_03940 [Saccharomycodes ludwigii]
MSVWKTATDGKRPYYYRTDTGETTWIKPVDLYLTEEEKLLLKHGWRIFTTKEGKVYYSNSKTNKSSWTIPNLDIATGHTRIEKKSQPIKATLDTNLQLKTNIQEFKNNSKLLNLEKNKSIDEAERLFMEMLKENDVDSTWSFKKIITDLSCSDPRYWVVDDDPLWKKAIFEKYLNTRTEDQLLEEHNAISKFKPAFIAMLESYGDNDKKKIKYYSSWRTVKRLIANEPIYKHSVVSEKIKRETFNEYIATLKSNHDTEMENKRERAIKELTNYLSKIIKDKGILDWKILESQYLFENNQRYLQNKNFSNLTKLDVLTLYLNLIEDENHSKLQKLNELKKKNFTQIGRAHV